MDFIMVIIKLKSNLNLQDLEGNTALHHAVIENKARIAYVLLIHGAKKNIKNNKGLTAK